METHWRELLRKQFVQAQYQNLGHFREHVNILIAHLPSDLKYTKDYIVDETSVVPILDNMKRSGTTADHRGMVKFSRNEAQGFRTVVAALRRYC